MAVFGDVHLGHRQNTASEIIDNLDRAFPDTAETAALDIIFIEGDLFDRLITITSVDVIEIQAWLVRFLRLCIRHDIILRVLEGTSSHDWRQFLTHLPLNKLANIHADVKYIPDLSIEYIDKLGINVLYVPDDLGPPEETLEHVKDLLRAKGLQTVDYAIMHGQFEYQLPPHVKAPKHDSHQYLSLVSELIFIGHVHQFSRYDRIVACGSFDRLGHNDEQPKGHVRHVRHANGDRDVKFIENTQAKKYVTLDCRGCSLDETIQKATDLATSLPQYTEVPRYSHIRLLVEKDHPIAGNLTDMMIAFPNIRWTVKKEDIETEVQDTTSVVDEEAELTYIPVQITKENVYDLLMTRLIRKGVGQDIVDTAHRLMKEMLV